MRMGRTAAVAGASGYAGGELLRLLLGHPDLELGPVAAGTQAGRPVTDAAPPAAPARRPDVRGHRAGRGSPSADLVFLALPHGESAALVAAAAGRPAGRRPRRRLPARRRGRLGALLRRPARRAPGPTACPSCPARARADRRRAGSRTPAATHRRRPRPRAAARRRAGRAGRRRRRRRLGHLRRRPQGHGDLLGQRGDGRPVGLQGRRRPPAHAGDGAGADRAAGTPVTLSFTPVLAPMPRGILATCTARLAPGVDRRTCARRCARRTATSRSCTCCPRAPGRRTAATSGSNSVHLQVAADAHAGRAVVVGRHRQPRQGRRRPGGAERQPRPRPATRRPACPRRGSRRERHRTPPRLPRRRRGRRAQGRAACPTSRSSSTTARPRRRRRVHRQPGEGRAGAVDPAGLADGRRRRRRAQLRRRQRLHRPGRASRTPTPPPSAAARGCSASSATDVAVCSTGLIGERLPIDALLAGVDAAAGRCSPTAAPTTRRGRS